MNNPSENKAYVENKGICQIFVTKQITIVIYIILVVKGNFPIQ